MHEVWYAAIGAIFVLGLLFVYVYSRRTPTATSPRHATADPDSSATQAAVALRMAEAEAASVRQLAQSESDVLRRSAQTEAQAIVRAAEGQAGALTVEAERVRGELLTASARHEQGRAALEADAARVRSEEAELDR
ncbi:MAG: hypothetical protein ABI232_12175, partial [Jatrophihabitantaceae bacterium]